MLYTIIQVLYTTCITDFMSEDILSNKAREALRHIRNSVMNCSKVPSVRELMKVMEYRSPRSAMLLLQELEENGFLGQKNDGSYTLLKDLEGGNSVRTVSVPLVGVVACGSPILAEENIEAMVPVSTTLIQKGSRHYLLKAKGNSMNEAGINDGDLLLIKQQSTAYNGDNVVALIDDEATVKEFYRANNYVTLLPRSTETKHQPIIVTADIQIQGIVVAVIPKINKQINNTF